MRVACYTIVYTQKYEIRNFFLKKVEKESGQFPCLAVFGVFRPRQENIDRIFAGSESGDDGAEVFFLHAGASGGGGSAVSAPDMEEDGGACAHDGLTDGFHGVVVDEHLDAVRIIRLSHLFLQFPGSACRMVEAYMAVVERRIGGVSHPQVCRADFDVRDGRVVLHRGCICHPQTSQRKDTGGGASVALFLAVSGRGGVDTHAPGSAVAAQSAGNRAEHPLPSSGSIFFDQSERNVRGIPAIGDADNSLCTLGRHGGGTCRKREYQQKNNKKSVKKSQHVAYILSSVSLLTR